MNLSGNFKIEITSETQVKAGKKQGESRGKQVKERNKGLGQDFIYQWIQGRVECLNGILI